MIIKTTNSKILDAFIEQTYESHGGVEAYESKKQDVFNKADEIQRERIKEAQDMVHRPQNLIHYMAIPTQLKEEELNQITEAHEHFADYDHSLEMDRLPALRAKYDYIAPEMQTGGTVEPSEIEMTTDSYDNIDPKDVPDLGGLFNDVFGI